jgi:hypothetical protein
MMRPVSTDEKIIGGGLAIGWAVLIGMILWPGWEAFLAFLMVAVPVGAFYWWAFRGARRSEWRRR